jgi:hypothetical protein
VSQPGRQPFAAWLKYPELAKQYAKLEANGYSHPKTVRLYWSAATNVVAIHLCWRKREGNVTWTQRWPWRVPMGKRKAPLRGRG